MPYTQPGKPETMKPPESNAKHPSGCLQNRGHFSLSPLRGYIAGCKDILT